jgi:hypothetical protein
MAEPLAPPAFIIPESARGDRGRSSPGALNVGGEKIREALQEACMRPAMPREPFTPFFRMLSCEGAAYFLLRLALGLNIFPHGAVRLG